MNRLIFLATIMLATASVVDAQKTVVGPNEDQQKPTRIQNQSAKHRGTNTMDWANFRRYAEANKQITKRPKAVLMGNSITEGWAEFDGEWLDSHNLVGRGISGQVSSQMLVRFRQDVISLKPECTVIMCGINDIALNQGIIKIENIMGNIISMVELAKANKIKPYLCSATPAANIGWRPEITNAPEQIKELNDLIKAYAKANKITYIDYYTALVAEDGVSLKKEFARDAVHPNAAGYKVMEEVLLKALRIKNKK